MALAFWAQDGVAFAASQQVGSVGSGLSRLFKWLGGADGSGPGSATGSADGVHRAPKSAGHPSGKAKGRGRDELAPSADPRTSADTGPSGTTWHGFEASTSKRSAAKSGARFDYFDNADGTFTRRMSQGVVNYQDAAGQWQPIDTTLERTSDGRLREGANSLGVSFATAAGHTSRPAKATSFAADTTADTTADTSADTTANTTADAETDTASDGPLATMVVPADPAPASVSWSLSGANNVTASVSGSTAEYDGILPDTNLLLEANGDGVKESLVLSSAEAPTTWVFPMTLTGLSLSTAADGTVVLVDSTGTVKVLLPKAYAFDASVDPVSGEHRRGHPRHLRRPRPLAEHLELRLPVTGRDHQGADHRRVQPRR
ncbi:hypothetical protein [Streptomyces sp. CBMA29]|uniref:hypothetical protein n=1 Tax=Streptomyces sp. CBMA29 TaxID=1896314 RepID=UPI0016618D2A|nr:hypothetical protein [Streptomyces sp. CBMA29]